MGAEDQAAAAHRAGRVGSQVCGVCGRVLQFVEPLDGSPSGWAHLTHDEVGDHPAVPVPVGINAALRCDFCSTDMDLMDGWIVPALNFQMMPGHMSDGNWKACDGCAGLVAANDWAGLIERVLTQIQSVRAIARPERRAMTAHLKGLYARLALAVTAAPYPVASAPPA